MENIVHSSTGLIHLIASLLSLISGTLVLALTKGTRIHKMMGYAYSVFMLILNVTAFGLFGLFGKFGPFHAAALVSLATLAGGMIPAMMRSSQWLIYHMSFMYYSVFGLYAAFVSEIIVRIPGIRFGAAVGIATALVMISAMIAFRSLSKRWQARYDESKLT